MGEVRVRFKKPAKLGQDSALALEDYARASSSFDAVVVLDSSRRIAGVHLAAGHQEVPAPILEDIERFFESLALSDDTADRLGWH
jgi:hypothetical protein